jgi:lipid-A-disaccharide synthase
MKPDLFIFAGEPSGDLHGAKLLKALYALRPDLQVSGVGGPHMRAVGMQCVMPMENFQVMGFIDVFWALPKLIRQFYAVRRAILEQNPKAVVLIDYPGFNLRMETHLRKQGYRGFLCHYICPSVWAWGKKRIPLLAKNLDLLLTILPFEAKYFSHTPLKVEYVGHPLVKTIQEHTYHPLPIPEGKRLVGLFPGSRKKELLRNFSVQLRVAKRLLDSHPDLFFGVSVANSRFLPLIQEMIRQAGLEEKVLLTDATYDLMKSCAFAIAKSGTVTLELALHGVPTAVTYGISPLDLFIAKHLLRIRLPYYCIVNIICQKEVFPELIGPYLTFDALFQAMHTLISEKGKQHECQKKLEELRQLLQDSDASAKAAQLILAFGLKNF